MMKKQTRRMIILVILFLMMLTLITPVFLQTQLRLGMNEEIGIQRDERWVFSIHPDEIVVGENVISPAPSTINPQSIEWSNTNPNVAMMGFDSMNQQFVISPQANGTAVFVGSDGVNPSLRIEVNVLEGIAFETVAQTIDIQQPLQLEVVTQPQADLLDFKPSFRSSDPEIVAVSQDGVALGVAEGTATIFTHFLGFETSLELTVEDLPDFSYDLDKIELNMQSSVQIPYHLSIYDEEIDPTITWASSHPNIVEVSSDGLLTAFNRGIATISATVNGQTYDLLVQVKSNVVDFQIEEKELTLNKGDQHTLNISFNPDIYSNYPITWTSSKPSIAQVVNGVVTAIGAGKTTITAQVDTFRQEVDVSVEVPLESITVSPSNVRIYEGQGVQLNPLYHPSDTTTKKAPSFTSSNPQIVRVDDKGFVIGEGVGSAIVFVNNAGFQYSVSIQVENRLDEAGNQIVSGNYRDGVVSFEGINFPMNRSFILEIPFESQFAFVSTVDLEVVLPTNFFDDEQPLFDQLVLNNGYIGKEVLLNIRKSTEPVMRYHFENYDFANHNLWANIQKKTSTLGDGKRQQWLLTMPITTDETHHLRWYIHEQLANQRVSSFILEDNDYVLISSDLMIDAQGFVQLNNFAEGTQLALEVPRLVTPFYTQWYFVVGVAVLVILVLTGVIIGSKRAKPKSLDIE